MTKSMRIGFSVAVVAVVILAVAYFVVSGRHQAPLPSIAGPSTENSSADAVPTAEFLKANPKALADAQSQCDSGTGRDVVALCDAVHSAKASLMADKFRQGAGGGSH